MAAMRFRAAIFAIVLGLAFNGIVPAQTPTPAPALQWRPWSDAVFAQARSEHKFVLLDLEAVWCHWCHVMDDVTYRDPIVMRLLEQRYLLVKVDQDARPDISNRYEDYGWPATVVFAGDGSEIVKRQGYIPPRPMASMLQAIINDPSPGPSVEKEAAFHPAKDSAIATSLLARIQAQFEKQYDIPVAGWGSGINIWMAIRWSTRCAWERAATQRRRGVRLTRCNMRQHCSILHGAGCTSIRLAAIGPSRTSKN